MASLEVGMKFESLELAKAYIKTYFADKGESQKAQYSDKQRFELRCKTLTTYSFKVRAAESKKLGVLLTHFIPHTYSPIVHFKARNIYIIKYLLPYYRAAILDNPAIKVKVIQSAERL